jgi:hypothetical protein
MMKTGAKQMNQPIVKLLMVLVADGIHIFLGDVVSDAIHTQRGALSVPPLCLSG